MSSFLRACGRTNHGLFTLYNRQFCRNIFQSTSPSATIKPLSHLNGSLSVIPNVLRHKHLFSTQSQSNTTESATPTTKEIQTCLQTTKTPSNRGKDRPDISSKFSQIGAKYDGNFVFERMTPIPEYECTAYEVFFKY